VLSSRTHPTSFSLSTVQRELEERTRSHDNLRARYEELLVSEAASRTKAQAVLALEEEVQALRVCQQDAETVPALRVRIEELITTNAEYKSRIENLEAERTDIARLRGEELKVLALTEAAADLQKKLDETSSSLARERDGRVRTEALVGSLQARVGELELETKLSRKEAEER